MNLVRAEVQRLAARRFVQLMVVLLAAAFAVTVATTLAGSRRPTADDLAHAEQQVAQQIREQTYQYDRCLAVRRGQLPPEEGYGLPRDCAFLDPATRPDRPRLADFLPGVFVFAHRMESLLYFLVAFLALFGFLVGSSFIGAELSSGGMTNLLLWRPQRMTVLGTKLGTLLGAVLGLSVVASACYVGAFWLIAQVRGLPGDVGGAFWGDLSLQYLRGLAVVLAAAALGFAIASLGRHTAAALGAVAAYVVVWELGARLVMEIIGVGRPDQLMLSSYLGALLAGRIDLWDRGVVCTDGVCDGLYELTWRSGLVVVTLLSAGALAVAFASFRRRDLA